MKILIIILAFLILQTSYLVFNPYSVFAEDCPDGKVLTEAGCVPDSPVEFTKQLYGMGLGLIGGIGLFFIIYGGYLIISSQGDPNQLSKGRSYIIYSIVGIIMAIAGFTIYEVITLDVVKLPGFTR